MRFFRRDCRTFLIRERKKERFLFSLYITLYISYGSMYPRTKKISRPPELHEHLHFTFVTIRLPCLTFTRGVARSFPVQQQQQQQQPLLPSPSIAEKLTDTAARLTLTKFCVSRPREKNVSSPPRHLEFLKILEWSGMGMTEILPFQFPFFFLFGLGWNMPIFFS